MSTQTFKVSDWFYLGFKETKTGLVWDLELKDLTLTAYGNRKNRRFEKLRKPEEHLILKMPIGGLKAYQLVASKLTENDYNYLTDLTYHKDPELINYDDVLEYLNNATRDIITEAEEGLKNAIIEGYKITGNLPVEFDGLGVSDNTIQLGQSTVYVNKNGERIATKNIRDDGNISNKIHFENILFEKNNIPFYFDAEMEYILNIKEKKRANPRPKRSSAIANLYIELNDGSTPQEVYNTFLSRDIKDIELREGIEILGVVDVLGKQRKINEPYTSQANGGLLLQITAKSEKDIQNLTEYINDTIKPLIDETGLKYRFLEETPEKISALDRASLNHIKQQIPPDEKANA